MAASEAKAATTLLKYYLHDSKYSNVVVGQLKHRLNIVSQWNIAPGSKVLEIGCGQGDCSVVLADAVGADGHITAIDPADLSYGSPYTLGEAQSHISNSEIGARLNFVRADPISFLSSTEEKFDAAVLFHCIWYFQSPETLAEILRALHNKIKRVLIAEYALKATLPDAIPHVLAATAQGTLTKDDSPEANIRTLLSPGSIKEIAAEGWKLQSQGFVVPDSDLLDGSWEVGGVLDEEGPVAKKARGELQAADMRERHLVKAQFEATKASLIHSKGSAKSVRTMDVWFCELEQ